VTDLYAALDLPKDAPPSAVKAAYRRAAKREHPDAGGSRESFALVKTAYDTLSDAQRRARYDATGEIGEKPADTRDSMAMTHAVAAVDAVLNAIARSCGQPENFDVVGDAVRHLATLRGQLEKAIADKMTGASQQRKLAKRFKAKPGKVNRLQQMFQARGDAMECDAARGREKRDDLTRAIKILEEHDFEVDVMTSTNWGSAMRGSVFT
jgi:curved DNA-binding protein CbpA